MILVIALKDFDLVEAGYLDAKDRSGTFGVPYVYNKKFEPYPKLAKTENLFITAHGDDDSVGDEGPTLEISAQQLAQIIKNLLPGGYTGNIYISTCKSINIAKAIKTALGDAVGNVYGTTKAIDFKIQGPKGGNWVLATP
jgi:hypothetical protein